MNINNYTRKDIGNLGEKIAAEYLRRNGFELIDRNVSRKTGEIDIIMLKNETLHFIEVKTVLCKSFPQTQDAEDVYQPGFNLHPLKIRKVVRTSEWYVVNNNWTGEWQVDAALVWVRENDGFGKVLHLPQIL